MPTPIAAYRQGYEKGRSDSAGGRLAGVTMGMLRDDPGGHFQKGYSDGAAGKPFSPPSIPQRSLTKGLIPKFSENPFGWFFGVLIVIEFWVLWQLIKAPFQLIGALMRSEKPSPWVIVRSAILVGVAVAVLIGAAGLKPSTPPGAPVPQSGYAGVKQSAIFSRLVGKWDGYTIYYDAQERQYKRGAEQHCEFVRDGKGVKFIGLDGQILAEDDVYLTHAGGKFVGSYLLGKHGGTHGVVSTQSFAFELRDDGTLGYDDSTWKHEYHKRQ